MLTIERTTPSDCQLRALLRMHYRLGDVRCVAGVWVARSQARVVGAMWVGYGVLNAPWRSEAWNDMPLGNRERALWINANVRTIARVVVLPSVRGCGVATALVRSYLARPLTPRTEALAAMGHVSPFFARAGMRELVRTPTPRERRLRATLDALGVQPWQLCDARRARELLRHNDGALGRAVIAWARESKASARHASLAREDDAVLVQLGMLAAASVCCPVKVYVAGEGEQRAGTKAMQQGGGDGKGSEEKD
jgi:GNAT superfamily N-acetyltransferase